MASSFEHLENTLISAQAANSNRIRKLEKQVATTTAELQKVHQLLSASPAPTQPHGKSSQKQGPTAPPHTKQPKAPRPWPFRNYYLQNALALAGGPQTPVLGRLHELRRREFTVDKPFITVERKKKKKTPEPIVPKPHLCTDWEVIITLNTTVTDAAATADQALQTINATIKGSSDIT
jgi:hypothetical protein